MTKFIIMRATLEGFQARGPVASGLEQKDAIEQLKALKAQYPDQDHVLFKEYGRARVSQRITFQKSEPITRKRKAALHDTTNVAPLFAKKEQANG